MNYWKVILATIVIFGTGVMTGGLLVNQIDHRPASHHSSSARGPEDFVPRPDILKTNFVDKLDDQVHLTKEQREKIEKIISDGQQRNHELWKLVSPQFRSVMQETRRRINGVLTPDQQKQFEQLLKQLHPPRRNSTNSTNAPAEKSSTNSPSACTPQCKASCA